MNQPVRALTVVAAVAALGLAACTASTGGEVPALREVTLSPSTLELAPGETADVQVEIVGEGDIGSVTITWSSDDPDVATAAGTGRNTGTVTAQGAGTTTVAAAVNAENAGRVTRTVEVTVTGG